MVVCFQLFKIAARYTIVSKTDRNTPRYIVISVGEIDYVQMLEKIITGYDIID
jgi:hypothetical protein